MNAQNIVPIGRAYARHPAAQQVTPQNYVELVKNRDMYRRLYDQNTAKLAQVHGDLYAARQQTRRALKQLRENRKLVRALERELAAHRAGEPLAILADAMTMLTDMVTNTREDERALGAVGVRLPATATQHTAAGEALISRAAPLLAHATGAA